jgi:cell division protease FtsH
MAIHRKRFTRRQAVLVIISVAIAGLVGWHYYVTRGRLDMSPALVEMRDNQREWRHQTQDLSVALKDLREGRVASMLIDDMHVLVTTSNGEKYSVDNDSRHVAESLIRDAINKRDQPDFEFAVLDQGKTAPKIIGDLIPLLLMLAFFYWPQLKARYFEYKIAKPDPKAKFDTVIGAAEAKAAMLEIAGSLKDPNRFELLGAKSRKGVLLSGPPGTGKTLLAKALANECKVNFIAVTAADFSSMWYGVGIERVKGLFDAARRRGPCIIFIDEIDGLGKRGGGDGGPVGAEHNRIVGQLLTEMDGFHDTGNIMVIAATNFPGNLDPALTREGRFDRKIVVTLPDTADREKLFQLYLAGIKAADQMPIKSLARLSSGMSPAAIAATVNEAATIAAGAGADLVFPGHLYEALDVIRMGAVTGGAPMSPEVLRRIAVHEAGHAIAAAVHGRIPEKVTIIPRGAALGVTFVPPPEELRLRTKKQLLAEIEILLAGRAAELLILEEFSSGAAADLKEASKLALSMVVEYGMGPANMLFSAAALDAPERDRWINEADTLLSQVNKSCSLLLTNRLTALEALTELLLEHETVTGHQIESILNNEPSKGPIERQRIAALA